MELPDGSEKLRIKKEIAQKIRREAERLEMSFPEMLYYIVNSYFIAIANQSHQVNQHHQKAPGVPRERLAAYQASMRIARHTRLGVVVLKPFSEALGS